jgi:hypothetical protein
LLENISGQVFLFIDACYAASGLELDSIGFVNGTSKFHSSFYAFASALDNQLSGGGVRENSSVFTKTVLEGLNGEAKLKGDKNIIRTSGLDAWLDINVAERSGKQQWAVMNKLPGIPHATIVRIPKR